MWELPFEIIINILYCVPVESLLRFRCVSKSWCSLIESPDFIKTHLNRSIENHTNLKLILIVMDSKPYQNILYSLDFYSPHTLIPFKNHLNDSYVLGSCNGLLLLKPLRHNAFVLFNPSTRQHRDVPKTPIEYNPLDGFLIPLAGKYGLGYDSFNDDYKIIMAVKDSVNTEVMVYSLKSNLWRKIGDFPYSLPPDIFDHRWGAHVNGALHILVRENFDFSSSSSQLMIAAFDVAGENFYLVPKPDFMQKENVVMSVDVLGGCLCLQGSYPDYIDVWVMKVYGVRESWTKLLSISSREIRSDAWVDPLDYSKSGDEVLLNFDGKKLIWYDLRRREIKNVEVCDLPKMLFLEVCVGSLVPVDGHGGSGEPKKQHKQEKKKSMSSKKRTNAGNMLH